MGYLQYVGERLDAASTSELSRDYVGQLDARPVVNVKGLRGKIKDELRRANRPLRSVDIAGALYQSSMGISRDKFTRRVIVNISAMYKEETHGIEKMDMDGRDALWRIDNNKVAVMQPMLSPTDRPEPTTVTLPSKATHAP